MIVGMQYRSPKRDIQAFAKEGYAQNIIVYRCIREIAIACSSVPFEVHHKIADDQIEVIKDHPILSLIENPNPLQAKESFIEAWVSQYLYSGNAYMTRVKAGNLGPTKELYLLNPANMTVQPSATGWPAYYEYKETGGTKRFDVNPVTGISDVLHCKTFSPNSNWYGMSPLEPGGYCVDIHNGSSKYNRALVDNYGAPPAMITAKGDNTTIGMDAVSRIREFFDRKVQGPENAGQPLILGSELTYTPLSLTSKDMEFDSLTNMAARNIASAYGVPFALVVPEAATYANMRDARESFWENTVLPLLNMMIGDLSNWLMPDFAQPGENLYLVYNSNGVSALEPKQQRKFDRMGNAVKNGIVTINEARRELGFEEIPGAADSLFLPSLMSPIDTLGLGTPDPTAVDDTMKQTLRDIGYSDDEINNVIRRDFGKQKETA